MSSVYQSFVSTKNFKKIFKDKKLFKLVHQAKTKRENCQKILQQFAVSNFFGAFYCNLIF